MKKNIKGNTVFFYDDNNQELMYIDHSIDECICFFNSEKPIEITKEMELYALIDEFMNNEYQFAKDELGSYKKEGILVWYSDCYYNPDDEWSIASVSCLTIKKELESYSLIPTKKLDEMINRKSKTYCICFSPAGNGKYCKNINTGLTLQDDFVRTVYQPLLEKNKVLVK